MKSFLYETMMWTLMLTVIGGIAEGIYSNGWLNYWLSTSLGLLGGACALAAYANKRIKYVGLMREFQWSSVVTFVLLFAYVIVNLLYNFLQHRPVNMVLIPGFVSMFFFTINDLVTELKVTYIPKGK